MLDGEFLTRLHTLERASRLEGTELGEWWAALCALEPNMVRNDATVQFQKVWQQEVEEQYEILRRQYKVTVREAPVMQKTVTLEYIGE